jgi:hypothetical protein
LEFGGFDRLLSGGCEFSYISFLRILYTAFKYLVASLENILPQVDMIVKIKMTMRGYFFRTAF